MNEKRVIGLMEELKIKFSLHKSRAKSIKRRLSGW